MVYWRPLVVRVMPQSNLNFSWSGIATADDRRELFIRSSINFWLCVSVWAKVYHWLQRLYRGRRRIKYNGRIGGIKLSRRERWLSRLAWAYWSMKWAPIQFWPFAAIPFEVIATLLTSFTHHSDKSWSARDCRCEPTKDGDAAFKSLLLLTLIKWQPDNR